MGTLDTATGAMVRAYSQAGPASYAAGGFLLDASGEFNWLGFVDVTVAETGSALEFGDVEILLNKDLSGAEAFGKAAIKLNRARYDRLTLSTQTGLPAGVTAQTAVFAAGTTSGSSHTHPIDHDHAAVNSSGVNAAGGATNTGAGTELELHTHANFNVANYTGSSGSSTHAHDRTFEYEHGHGLTSAATALTLTEPTGVDLSAVTFKMLAVGFGEE